FAEKKLEPLRRHNDVSKVSRVLDVGCGPGTNARHFSHADYLGLDLNPAYVEYARRRYSNRCELADVTHYSAPSSEPFDFVLVNSLLHHIDAPNTRRLLAHLATLLS